MNFFSGSKPNLINDKIRNTVNEIINAETDTRYTISEKILNLLSNIYTNYIKKRIFFVAIFMIIIIFLIYRYCNRTIKSSRNYGTQEKYKNTPSIMDDIKNTLTKHLMFNTQPSFDRLHSVKGQEEKVYYPPDPLPININDKIIYTRNIYKDPKRFPILNTPKYNYDNVYTDPSLSYYTGTSNIYKNAQDTNIQYPLEFSNKFNTTTGNFVNQMTDKNKQNILNYQTIIDNRNIGLTNSLTPQLNTPYVEY